LIDRATSVEPVKSDAGDAPASPQRRRRSSPSPSTQMQRVAGHAGLDAAAAPPLRGDEGVCSAGLAITGVAGRSSAGGSHLAE
jgi:hypothetical protein